MRLVLFALQHPHLPQACAEVLDAPPRTNTATKRDPGQSAGQQRGLGDDSVSLHAAPCWGEIVGE